MENLTPDTTWDQICKHFENDKIWKKMHDSYKIKVFKEIMMDL